MEIVPKDPSILNKTSRCFCAGEKSVRKQSWFKHFGAALKKVIYSN